MTVAPSGPAFSVREIPFSHRGSWLSVSPVVAENTYADDLHLVSHRNGMHPVLRFSAPADATVTARPALLSWHDRVGRVELTYAGPDTLRLRGRGAGLRITAAAATLTPFSGTYLYDDPTDSSAVFTSYETGRRYRVTVLAGTAETVGAQALGTADRGLLLPADRPWEVAIEEYATARRPYPDTADFDDLVDAGHADFAAFVEAVAPWRDAETPAAELAGYVLWSATVGAAGFVTRPAVLMSKHWMNKVWSWDHCFNALALADGDADLAWHQFHLPFDHMDDAGALPDSVTHSEILHNFVKPPIHGWALRRLRQRSGRSPSRDDLVEVYERLARWTTFWLDHRRAPGRCLPHYQHGNDSGWDNATTFDDDRVIETPDLAAFLAIQLGCLAELADELERPAEAARWAGVAGEVREALLGELWTGERFTARAPGAGSNRAGSNRAGSNRAGSSLLDLMPVVLGEALPAAVAAVLARRVESHLTEHGLATEPLDSPYHAADGYWRGPIWAPATVLIEDGLRRAGHTALADEISRRFRVLCERSGFAENFDAKTGAGLRDRAYTWTASGYLLLAGDDRRRRAGG
ncbi:glycogen debranching protein [Micromonospora sp. WMMD1128]|uniref:amylo-alpha-1,6-glucosidase n=1 Tax=unclassified Micromonospora TaxID=2617518 RepID=UPI00248C3654|nr:MULTISPECIES: glycogen debranching protein [unclassified Micromonospora]WBB71887.1 glycogen debranching protein [Micromonospora sp. WMMD1128]WFE34667.1 glycogen debranching protein [Micromonospora sp. WMMD975]